MSLKKLSKLCEITMVTSPTDASLLPTEFVDLLAQRFELVRWKPEITEIENYKKMFFSTELKWWKSLKKFQLSCLYFKVICYIFLVHLMYISFVGSQAKFSEIFEYSKFVFSTCENR